MKYIATPQSLACFVSEWLPAVRPSLKPSTWDSYRSNLTHHVLPRLGEIPLTEIGPTDLNRLYVELLDSGRVDDTGGLSQKTVHYIHTIVHRTLRDAIRWAELGRNAAELCDPPRQLHPEVTAWGEPEVRAFLAGMRTERLYALYLLALTTGMRRGELLGLSWDSVDVASRRAQPGSGLSLDESCGAGQLTASEDGRIITPTPMRACSLASSRLTPIGAFPGGSRYDQKLWNPELGGIRNSKESAASSHLT